MRQRLANVVLAFLACMDFLAVIFAASSLFGSEKPHMQTHMCMYYTLTCRKSHGSSPTMCTCMFLTLRHVGHVYKRSHGATFTLCVCTVPSNPCNTPLLDKTQLEALKSIFLNMHMGVIFLFFTSRWLPYDSGEILTIVLSGISAIIAAVAVLVYFTSSAVCIWRNRFRSTMQNMHMSESQKNGAAAAR
jgi:hypothetical protein